MVLRAILVIAIVVALPAAAAALTAEQAYTLVVQKPWSTAPPPKPEELAAARKALESAAAKEPSSARWSYALGHLTALEARTLPQGDASEKKRKEAVAHFERAAEREPKNADYQFWLADASFERIDDVNMLSQVSIASTGKKALEKAVALDPGHVGAHRALAEYYMQAPGIAGGSIEKAKKEGEALIAIPSGRGAYLGNMLLAGIAGKARDWVEMSKRFTAAETAGGDAADPAAAMRSHAWLLIHEKKDAASAQQVIDRYLKIAKPGDLTALFLDGEVKRELGRCADALPRYQEVLAKYPAASGSRWGSAVCNEATGRKDAARRDYEEFLQRFPKDEKAKEAKEALKRLG